MSEKEAITKKTSLLNKFHDFSKVHVIQLKKEDF